ncbi:MULTISPECIES: LamG-like jellyroll fold domain-containing protein [unclassified Lysinibacillus]|uniref:LamG-like jellyroll fold domain-containing protein n=1 Tax=unclassified Lysinibacillus TaxID=2636778 RepID=UPI0038195488
MATTEQLMYQSGVAWFGFDEASGNVVDKLGNGYTGTVTGATRVEGWNSEGQAINFGGGQYALFNAPIIPLREKTIRFKFKKNTTAIMVNNVVFSTTGTSTGNNGFYLALLNDIPTFYVVHNGVPVLFPFLTSIKDTLWHEVYITIKDKILTLYLDDVQNAVYSNYTETFTSQTYGLYLARYNTSALYDFNGQIDDLQIYNKALSPSDFTQKRLVVKTTDNKNLVFSPTSTRVKEIPNTVEYMLLAQGGVIKEIDSAVDRPPIDFTKTTTEYEIVSNDKTPLGKNRMISIPIGSDFKTAMIEDNY